MKKQINSLDDLLTEYQDNLRYELFKCLKESRMREGLPIEIIAEEIEKTFDAQEITLLIKELHDLMRKNKRQ